MVASGAGQLADPSPVLGPLHLSALYQHCQFGCSWLVLCTLPGHPEWQPCFRSPHPRRKGKIAHLGPQRKPQENIHPRKWKTSRRWRHPWSPSHESLWAAEGSSRHRRGGALRARWVTHITSSGYAEWTAVQRCASASDLHLRSQPKSAVLCASSQKGMRGRHRKQKQVGPQSPGPPHDAEVSWPRSLSQR